MEQGMELSPEQMSEREQRRTEIEQTFLVPVKSTVPSQSVLHQNPIASQTSLSVLAFFLAIQLQHRKALHHETQSLISYHRVSLDTTHLTRKAKISLSKHCMPCALQRKSTVKHSVLHLLHILQVHRKRAIVCRLFRISGLTPG